MFERNKFLSDLGELINIDCGTYTPSGTKKIADILSLKFQKIGFKTKQIDVGNKVGPLFIAYNKDVDYYDAVLIGHLDTVYKEGEAEKHQMKVVGNKVYGLGSIDMKSGLLQGLYAVESLDKKVLDKLSLCFIYNSDEEISSIFCEPDIIKLAKKAKCALVLETACEDKCFTNKRKGISRYKAIFEGKAAHASTPEKGASAITELAHFIIKLQEFNNPNLDTTFNVSPIKGGTTGNVIAGNAELEFEIRFLDAEIQKGMEQKIDTFVKSPVVKGVKIHLEQLSSKPPLNNKKENAWIEDLVMKSAKNVGLGDFKMRTSGGGSDGNILSHIGIPTMDGLGPLGEGLHNANEEFLYIDTMESRIKLLQEILTNLTLKN